jgi:hypothetical protein
MFLTDVLFNSPHLRFSEAQKRAVLRWGKDLGAQDVPKLHALDSFQKKMMENMGKPTSRKSSCRGNIYYINDIGDAIAKVVFYPPHTVNCLTNSLYQLGYI